MGIRGRRGGSLSVRGCFLRSFRLLILVCPLGSLQELRDIQKFRDSQAASDLKPSHVGADISDA